jgi:tetratricopeptide (TPR) repeat protein
LATTARRGTFLIRDPYYRPVSEMQGEGLLETHRSTGPRGMVLVPLAQSHLLDGIDLPEAPLYDLLHHVNRALQEHNRAAASTAYEEMQRDAAEHRLTLQARRALAAYDADSTELLACTETLLQQFPDDANLQLARLSYSRGFETRDERLRRLREIAEGENTDPLFWQQYAQELDDDAREHATALRWIKRSLRARPLEAGSLYILGNICGGRASGKRRCNGIAFAPRFRSATSSFRARISARPVTSSKPTKCCVFCAAASSVSASVRGTGAHAVLGAESADRTEEAFRVLEDALAASPRRRRLLLLPPTAGPLRAHGARDECCKARRANGEHVVAARGGALASYRGELKESLAQWQRVLEAEPLSIDAHENVVAPAGPDAESRRGRSASGKRAAALPASLCVAPPAGGVSS